MSEGQVNNLVTPIRAHTRFERARIIGARALQIGMGAPIFVDETTLREEFKEELVSIYGMAEKIPSRNVICEIIEQYLDLTTKL